jgi:tetratricopeptide (TPR) repeat protein
MKFNDEFNSEDFKYYLFKQVKAYEDRGRLRAQQGDYYGAIQEFEELLKIVDDYPDGYMGLGIFYEKIGDLQSALENYSQAIHVDPNWDWSQPRYGYGDPYYCRGSIRARQGNFKGAIEDYTQRIEFHPEHAAAYAERGHCFYGLQNYIEAKRDWMIASDLYYKQGAIDNFQKLITWINNTPDSF